ncbi:MAG TPA: sodium/proline symporter [Candidatus Copromorpha excrementigallinarum]|uniref:Sodium/proline symporter n=1 Tax=Candidatus Allocopromorpha excrementigallinarum TaxID=2840742 RepID=A0A9D1I2A3_9FIRM|nr:sodium/proline symporter [Candidatus Copromorpha excrementigallinarum]
MRAEVIVLCLYFIGMVGMGLYWNKRAKSSEDYMLGGRSMGPLVTALTLQTTAMSGFMFMGGPAEAFSLGYFAIFYAVGDGAGGMINLTVLGRRMRRLSQLLDAISPIEYLEKRYESVPVKVIACVIAVFGLGCYVLAQFLATGNTLLTLFGFPLEVALVVGVGVILIYTFLGGYFAVAYTDVIQGFIMIGSIILVFVKVMYDLGGFTGLNEKLAEIDPTLLSVWGRDGAYEGQFGVIAGAVGIYLIGYMGLPHSVNKHMAMGSPKTAKASVIYATIWTQLFCFIPYFLGLAGCVMFTANPEGLIDGNPELVIPSLTQIEFPGVVSGLMLCAIMSAIMSTVAALMLLIATIVSIDFYKRWLRKDASDRSVVFVSKGSIIAVAVIGVIIAIINPPGIFNLVVDTFSFMGCAFLPSYVFAVWWKKANATGSIVSMIVGGATVQVWSLGGLDTVTGLHQFFIGALLSFIAMIIFSNFGKPTSPEMKDLIERAKGKKITVSKKVQVASSKHLSTENKAITQFVFSKKMAMEPQA